MDYQTRTNRVPSFKSYQEYLKQTGEAAVWAGKNIENASKKVSKIEIAKGFANNLMSL